MTPRHRPYRVLFVCTGNICRSPTAHAIFAQKLLQQGLQSKIEVDSAGTSAYHVGEPPDTRSMATAMQHGVDMQGLRARQCRPSDWLDFDLILVAGHDHLALMQRSMPAGWPGRLALILDQQEVPDPYYGGADGFTTVFALLDNAAERWLEYSRAQLPTT